MRSLRGPGSPGGSSVTSFQHGASADELSVRPRAAPGARGSRPGLGGQPVRSPSDDRLRSSTPELRGFQARRRTPLGSSTSSGGLGSFPRRASPEGVRGHGARSASPALPRAPGAAQAQVPDGGYQFDDASAVPPSVLESLARITAALERGAAYGAAGSAASKAVLAAVTAIAGPSVLDSVALAGAGDTMSGLPLELEERLWRVKRSLADVRSPGEASRGLMQVRADRVEKEVAELRARMARRLDTSEAEVLESRRGADDARNELIALRQEVAALSARLDKAERSAQLRDTAMATEASWTQLPTASVAVPLEPAVQVPGSSTAVLEPTAVAMSHP